ncbi:MAG: helix-turn-helix transcriptional regulator [Pseudomonadota bacterium]
MDPRPIPAADTMTGFSLALRRFRAARRMSQLELSLECNVSARHVSFLETGRAKPSREMVLQLARGLVLPLSAQNTLLSAAGFAPAFPASPLESDALGPLRDVLSEMIARHGANPAMLCDRHWSILDANAAARRLLSVFHGDAGETNVIRMLTQNSLSAELVENYPEVLAEMRGRLQLEALEAGDDGVLRELLADVERACADYPVGAADVARRPLVPIIFRTPTGRLSFLSTIAHFGTSEDVTVRDLRLELFFPADQQTRDAMAMFEAVD